MIVGFMIMHYGSDYAGWAIKSIYDHVDKILVAYSHAPSHGHATTIRNPEPIEDCKTSVYYFGDPQNKIHWVEGNWPDEGQHRSVVWHMYPQAKLVCVVDADEIWHPHEFAAVKEWVLKTQITACKQLLRTPWRSFSWICDDNMAPDRWLMPRQKPGFALVPRELGTFYHFGYARKPYIMEYKMSIHGHKGELRPNWLIDKFVMWERDRTITDVHPTCVGIWNPKPFDKNLLPVHMRQHPYWNLDIIK